MPNIFTLSERPSAAITGTQDRFPVGRIICIGRNYEAHAREMGKDPNRDAPFFFSPSHHSILILTTSQG